MTKRERLVVHSNNMHDIALQLIRDCSDNELDIVTTAMMWVSNHRDNIPEIEWDRTYQTKKFLISIAMEDIPSFVSEISHLLSE